MMYRLSSATFLLLAACGFAETKKITIVISPSKSDVKNAIVRVALGDAVPAKFKTARALGGPFLNDVVDAQLTSLPAGKGRDVIFVLASLTANTPAEVTVELDTAETATSSTGGPEPVFVWKDPEGTAPALTYDGKVVLQYVRPQFDPAATPPKQQGFANPTTKIYHHFYDQTGKVRLTNGPDGQYPHHRGLFYGFNRVSYDGQQADIWHCVKGESQRHDKFLGHEAGALFGKHRVGVTWNGQDGKPFASEEREVTVYHMAEGRLIEFASRVTTDRDLVRLDGDPQHAGFHFRAAAEVEKVKDDTYFLRPDGKGDKGQEKNWEPKTKEGPKNLPWNAMSFLVGGKRYTALYLDHPDNPKEARQSERTYGRIGTYFEYDLTKDKPLAVRYRVWVQNGEMTVAQCEAMSQAFVNGPRAKVK